MGSPKMFVYAIKSYLEALKYIKKNKLKNSYIYRTDEDGTIKIDSDGKNISVSKLDVSLDGN